MTEQTFTAQVEQRGTKTVIVLPFDPDTVWGEKARHHVAGIVNGHKLRGPLRREGQEHILTLGPAWLRDTGIEAGTTAAVVLAPEGPQSTMLAEDINAALAAEPQARDFFDSLPTFYRKNYQRWIDSAKRPETRSARIAEMVGLLKSGKRERQQR